MSQEIRRELQVIPAQVKVIEHVQEVYACRQCERDALTTPIKTAPMPRPVYPGSLASPSLLAFTLHQNLPNICLCIGRNRSGHALACRCPVRP
ncbi:IS66 family transposase zinc-finger binding domain-containing protein [Sulfobacillus thermosulfidooxidans]|uniref:IS66 family transposase zinc-finger binding domain-containing protein n=1 Tax=Sulfobacillus thermosulfidooxidans TaxID=28034 RepID=UPI002418BBFD|nr:IS66 family transposase zinc-finger binding domain-containing protein [Sulfobacillus thermosulfidooxidans]